MKNWLDDSGFSRFQGKEMVFFSHPHVLLDEIIKTLNEIGSDKFFSCPNKDIKLIRESMAEYFFVLALKKATHIDWLIRQLKDDPPDFELFSVGVDSITFMQFELVEIPPRCETPQQMISIIQGKMKMGYPANKYSLLIFMNHEKSKEWVSVLNDYLVASSLFNSIWIVYLLWHKNKGPLYSCTVNRLRPLPVQSINASFDDNALGGRSPIPDFMEEIVIDSKVFMYFKEDFVKEFIKFKKHLLQRDSIQTTSI